MMALSGGEVGLEDVRSRLGKIVEDRRVMVTGGAGFIGSHLVEVLTERNKVFVYDDLSTGAMHNLDDLDAELVVGSLLDQDLLQRTVKGMDFVFHLGALPSVPRSIEDPIASNLANQNGTLNLLMAAKEAKLERVIYASSSSVYGDAPQQPKREDMLPAPMSPYAVAKLAGEYYCQVFHHLYGLGAVSLRFFNVFGPRQDPSSQYAAVVPKFIAQAREGRKLTIFGDGGQSRDFTYVLDVVQGCLLAATRPQANGMVMNVARGESISVNRLASMVLQGFGRKVDGNVTHLPARPGEIRDSLADISQARKVLGFEPWFTMERGLALTMGL
jgi:nucleoside-diphosphate-sugar epimerase